jgi:hypothetical protein
MPLPPAVRPLIEVGYPRGIEKPVPRRSSIPVIPVRTSLAAAAAVGLLLGSTACSGKSSPSAGPAAPATLPTTAPSGVGNRALANLPSVDPTVAASADAALRNDTKALCQQADRTSTTFGSILIADLKLQHDVQAKDAQTQADAKQKLAQDVSDFSYALADMSKLAGNATLKSTLQQMSRQVTAFAGDPTKINSDRISQLSDTLATACGKG